MKQLDLNFNEKYRYWDVLDELPDGWMIDETTSAPLFKTVFIKNFRSPLTPGFKRALLRVNPNPAIGYVKAGPPTIIKKKEK